MVCHSLLQGYSWSRDQTQISGTTGKFFTFWTTREAPTINLSTITDPKLQPIEQEPSALYLYLTTLSAQSQTNEGAFLRYPGFNGFRCKVPQARGHTSWERDLGRTQNAEGFPCGSVGENLPAVQETWVQSLGQEDPLEEEMATHSGILAWRIPRTEKPGRLQSMGSHVSQTWLSD